MKIGEYSDSFLPIIDGVGRVVKAYTETLAHRGHQVYAIAPMADMGFRGNLPYEIVDYSSMQMSKSMPWRIGLDSLDPHFAARMRYIDLDICHVHSPVFAGHIGLKYARQHNVPIVATLHSKYYDDILKVTKSHALARLGANMVADFYQQCDEVWTVSEDSARTLKSYGYKGDVIVMTNGTDKHVLHKECIEDLYSLYPIKKNVPILLFVGQINFKKGIDKVIECCALLKKDGVNFQLVLAGQGPDEQACRNLAEKVGISDRMVMTGHLSDIRYLDCLYYISTLFVFPSVYDSAPLVTREACAMHTACLTVENCGASEPFTDMYNGLVSKNTVEDIYKKISDFLSMPADRRHEIAENGFNTVPIPWDGPIMDRVIERYQNLIDLYKFKNRN
ncbi:MAG: glycosyltransferase [Sphaerochaetaceae bacterium]|nr:glycosyltransferase [Sphaerochaetaceae bacterium]